MTSERCGATPEPNFPLDHGGWLRTRSELARPATASLRAPCGRSPTAPEWIPRPARLQSHLVGLVRKSKTSEPIPCERPRGVVDSWG